MIRAGALVCSSGISRFVSRNGPTTLVASVSSIPSAETAAFLRHHAGVVDQHIEARTTICKPSGEPVDRLEAAEVAVTHVHVAVTGALGDPHARLLAALRAAANQPHGGAQARKALSGGEAEPRAGARD